MPADQSHPFATFPAAPGKGVNGLRPYYTPGLTTDNYTTLSGQPLYYNDEYDDLIDSKAAARELINFTVLKYITTAINSPFEVSKTLLQVQYMPHEDVEVLSTASHHNDEDEDHDSPDEDEDEDEDEDDFYGTGGKRRHSTEGLNFSTASLDADNPAFKKKVSLDESGYVVRASVYDESTRPTHQIKPIEGGVWQGIGLLMKQPHEGWRSLFKGQYTNWVCEVLHLFLQPTLEGTLNDMFDLYDDTIPLVHLDRVGPNLATLVASNLIVGFILSPLEIIKTRMMVQSASPLQRKYKGPFHALRTILNEEGGLRGLYLSHNLVPTLLYHSITPLLQNTIPLIIDRVLRISANDSPFLYGLAELGLNTLELIITLPLDTIRKRLQCQIRSRTPGNKRFESVVALRPVPYTGIMDAFYHIVKEEGGRREVAKGSKKTRQRRLSGWGLRGLYQGFSMQFTSDFVLFLLHAINGIEGKPAKDTIE
ncbi:mitochondrial carrier domain-containing protein [Phycomyces nitens]|nr:mitochondrial carrier domain-containing protein [Phycomyces nitens]